MPSMQDDDPAEQPSSGGTDVLRLPPREEIEKARGELWRLQSDRDAFKVNLHAWVRRWKAEGYHVSDQFIDQLLQVFQQQQQQRQQEEQQRQQLQGKAAPTPQLPPAPEDVFFIEFSPDFTPEEAQIVANFLAHYFRACGGAGFEYEFGIEEAATTEKS